MSIQRKHLSLLTLLLLLSVAYTSTVLGFWINELNIDLQDGDDTYYFDREVYAVEMYFDWDDFTLHQDYDFNVSLNDAGGNVFAKWGWDSATGGLYLYSHGDSWGPIAEVSSESFYGGVGMSPSDDGYIYTYLTDVVTGSAALVGVLDMVDTDFDNAYHYVREFTSGWDYTAGFNSITISGAADLTDDTFTIIIDGEAVLPPGPSDDSDTLPDEIDALAGDLLEFAIPLGIIVCPLGVVYMIGARDFVKSKWGIMICLFVGAALGTIFFGLPVWVVFGIIVTTVAMAFLSR